MVIRLELEEESALETCSFCGRSVPVDDIQDVDGVGICSNCAELNAIHCHDCGALHLSTNLHTTYTDDDEYLVCDECAEDYWRCPECGNYYVTALWDREHNMCRECSAIRGDELEYRDERALNYYSYKPKPFFVKRDNERTQRFFGMEIEIGDPYSRMHIEKFYRDINSMGRRAYLKSDSSIRTGGYECVTHPMSESELHRWIDEGFAKAVDGLRLNTEGCGVHIHVTRKSIGTLSLFKITTLLNLLRGKANRKFIKFLTNRNDEGLDRWCRIHNRLYFDFLDKIKTQQGIGERYMAVNHNNEHTIEFRLFGGSVLPETLHGYVDILSCMLDFVANTSLKNITYGDLFEYMLAHKASYPYLKDLLIGLRTDTQTGAKEHFLKLPADSVPDKYDQYYLWLHNYSGTLRSSIYEIMASAPSAVTVSQEKNLFSVYSRIVGKIPVKELLGYSNEIEKNVLIPMRRRIKDYFDDCTSVAPLKSEYIKYLNDLFIKIQDVYERVKNNIKNPRGSTVDREVQYLKLKGEDLKAKVII